MIEEDACSTAPRLPRPRGRRCSLIRPGRRNRFSPLPWPRLAGLASWIGNYTSPTVAQLGGSYLGGYLIGWAFRRFLRMAAMMVAVGLACIGCDEDDRLGGCGLERAGRRRFPETVQWLHGEAEGFKNVVTGFLAFGRCGRSRIVFRFPEEMRGRGRCSAVNRPAFV